MRPSSARRAPIVAALLMIAMSLAVSASAAAATCFGKRATIVGTRQNDRLVGTARADVIVAKGGRDLINGRGGNDLICAGAGGDAVMGRDGRDRIRGQGGTDEVLGGGGNDRIVLGGGFFQFANGGPGDDRIKGGPGFDISGYFNARQAVTVDLAASTATGQGSDTLVSVEGALGSSFDDMLRGTDGTNFLIGLAGNDTLESRGNAGTPTTPESVFPNFQFDFLVGDGEEGTEPGNDTLIGGAGLNVASFEDAPTGVDVSLQNGTATGEGTDTLQDINGVVGSEFDDTLTGDAETNLFEGLSGNDDITGRAGEDILVFFDARRPTIDLAAGSAAGNYTVFTNEGEVVKPFTWTFTGIESVWGSATADTITGDDNANRLFGLNRADQISGAGGDDYIDGMQGEDTLNGGAGTDTCVNGETLSNCESEGPASRLGAPSAFGVRPLLDVWGFAN